MLSTMVYNELAAHTRRHRVQNPELVSRLVASMMAEGWQGPPLVVHTTHRYMLVGVHRLAALDRLSQIADDLYDTDPEAYDRVMSILNSVPVVETDADIYPGDHRDSEDLAYALRECGETAAAQIVESEG